MNTHDIESLKEKYKKDFKRALDIYEIEYSHDELINYLKNGSVVEKQIAVLKLDKLDSKEDVNIYINNLTGCDGKIREAVSFRLREFINANPQFFEEYTDIFIDAIADINGNICRNTINALNSLKSSTKFCDIFCSKLIETTYKIAKVAQNFDIQDGKYKINKDIFKLYWYLETIYEFTKFVNEEDLLKILNITENIFDYTIREKTAKILSKLNNPKFIHLKEKLKNDENYYVRRI